MRLKQCRCWRKPGGVWFWISIFRYGLFLYVILHENPKMSIGGGIVWSKPQKRVWKCQKSAEVFHNKYGFYSYILPLNQSPPRYRHKRERYDKIRHHSWGKRTDLKIYCVEESEGNLIPIPPPESRPFSMNVTHTPMYIQHYELLNCVAALRYCRIRSTRLSS